MKDKEQRILFAAGAGDDGIPVVILGIPAGAWEHIKDGKSNDFDLTKAGIPVKLVVFGGKDHSEIMKNLDHAMKQSQSAYLDERHSDFSINNKG